jgi:hypothetical protein
MVQPASAVSVVLSNANFVVAEYGVGGGVGQFVPSEALPALGVSVSDPVAVLPVIDTCRMATRVFVVRLYNTTEYVPVGVVELSGHTAVIAAEFCAPTTAVIPDDVVGSHNVLAMVLPGGAT